MPSKVPPARVVRVVEAARHRLRRTNGSLVPAPVAMFETITGAWLAKAISAAAELGIADALADGPLTVDQLAERVGADPDALGRLMRLLVSQAVFKQKRDGRFAANHLGDALRSDAPNSMRGFALFIGDPAHWEHWGQFTESVRTGQVVVPRLRDGMGFFDYLEKNKELAANFNEAMTNLSNLANESVLAAYEFSRFRNIVDVGGGQGKLLAAILGDATLAEGVLFDLASVVETAPAVLGTHGVAERVTIEAGSFFDHVPTGGDLYVLKNIIHDWAEPKALDILRTVRRAMDSHATLALIELVLPKGHGPHAGKLVDLEMLCTVGGRERTKQEYRDLLRTAGFKMTNVVPTASPVSIVEASPA